MNIKTIQIFDNELSKEELQEKVAVTVKKKGLTCSDLDFFASVIETNPDIIEQNLTDIFSAILAQSVATFDDSFLASYQHCLFVILKIFSKLQRINKFIFKLLPGVKNINPDLNVQIVLPPSFVTEFSAVVSTLPSLQSLAIFECLLQELDGSCINVVKEKEGVKTVLLIQIICELLIAYLLGFRMLGHSVPKSVFDQFHHNVENLQEILGKFGASLLSRTHDRDIVRPFLKLSFYWGEVQTLIIYYMPEHSEAFDSREIAPTDLSILHSYLDGEQWSVLAERVSNFGAGTCNQLFLKLVLQKLRLSKLVKTQSVEATSKYILVQLTSELYKHNIIEELTSHDLNLLLNYLTSLQARTLIEKLVVQLLQSQDKLSHWLLDPSLLENKNFLIHVFSVSLRQIGLLLDDGNEPNISAMKDIFTSFELFGEDNNVDLNHLKKLSELTNAALGNWRQISELITKKKKLIGIKNVIEVIKILPVTNLANEISALALLSSICLAIICRGDKDLTSTLLRVIGNNIGGGSFDLCLGIKWLVEFDSWPEDTKLIRYKIIDSIVRSSPSTKSGLHNLGQLVRSLRKRKNMEGSAALETQILVYDGLGKCWLRSKSRKADNDQMGKYREKLSECITADIENNVEASQDILLKAYCIALRAAVNKKKDDVVANLIKSNFNSYFENSINGLNGDQNEACKFFLSTILFLTPEIKSHLPKDVVLQIWSSLKTCENTDWQLFVAASSDEEFKVLAQDLVNMTNDAITKSSNDMQTCFNIWLTFLKNKSASKTEICENHLELIFCCLQSLLSTFHEISSGKTLQVLKFLRFCTLNSEAGRSSYVQDSMFDFIFACKFEAADTVSEFSPMFTACVEIALSLVRQIRMKNKIQNEYKLFTFLLRKLVARSDVAFKLSDEDVTNLASCAFFLQKWTSSMIKMEKDFSRIASYFIAEIVALFVRTTIYPQIKVHLVNSVYNFLSISDSYAISSLMRALSPACQQVFNKVYDHYKKFYKFTGKI